MPFWKRRKPNQPHVPALEPRTHVPELEPLIRCWSLSGRHHEWCPGASDSEIADAENSLNLCLPRALRAIYELSNGVGLVGGNVAINALTESDPDDLSLVGTPGTLREWDWVVPDELLIFGGDGSESTFGLWLPERTTAIADCPVIELTTGDAMAIAGTSFCRFLKGRTAYYLLMEEADQEALDALGLPAELQSDEFDDDHFAQIIRWADPDIPDPLPDPYQRGVTVQELRDRFGSTIPRGTE